MLKPEQYTLASRTTGSQRLMAHLKYLIFARSIEEA